ncbi:hypothetical protein SAICODRAFT_29135 [Saitoella complicata NRRL Y-17804]|uniref:uncharacterized protein n=1 Tax=Saitoella complicata (strain BCRC 22490 / CBS 7301 / JCM 7358 / NBRC 10748 / NRRL Y-17804) TaxID=698492 RepID=UPI000868142A|nr:uncharacterized protein SAICODRAFT_29135 [Saitoella complicata NRRL Y-17804]ODQ54907.1 hypothetical protein SAICODRAFT_29135 [Saitoella complicata NRRL Y-17804]
MPGSLFGSGSETESVNEDGTSSESPAGLEYIPNALPDELVEPLMEYLAVNIANHQQLHLFPPIPAVILDVSRLCIPQSWKDKLWNGHDMEAGIIQKYEMGQGIGWHVDLDRFTDGVAILSLLSATTLSFRHVMDHARRCDVKLEPGSAVLMSGEARYEWEHSIEAKDWDGSEETGWWKRGRRISVTMRRVRDDRKTES